MRKWIVPVLVVLVLIFAAALFLKPNKIAVKETVTASFSAKAFSRHLFKEAPWPRWWPGTTETDHAAFALFSYKGNQYIIRDKRFSSILLTIGNGNDSLLTELVLIPVNADSIELEWIASPRVTGDAVGRLPNKQWVKNVAKDMQLLLQKMKAFYTNVDNLYAFPIKNDVVRDSTLISTSAIYQQYPTTEKIYTLIDNLKAFAQKNGARQTGFPMLNITPNKDGTYTTKVALPVDTILKDEGDVHYRWMLGGGNILVAEVSGGPQRIQKAFAEMEEYIEDFRRIAPAIPFQSLVTDRRLEPDTAKWVTKIYWPVM